MNESNYKGSREKYLLDADENNFCANFLFDMLGGSHYFLDEQGAIIKTIKVENTNYLPLYAKPKLYYDLFPTGLKPRRIKKLDPNFTWVHLQKLDYAIATKSLSILNRWNQKIRVQTQLFRFGQIPKGWRAIGRIPPYHYLAFDVMNMQIQLVGPSVNEYGRTNWFPIIYKEEYKEEWDNFYEALKREIEEEQYGRH
jgi:hypothetical protein